MPPKGSPKKGKAAKEQLPGPTVDEAKTLISELCSLFYDQGWVGGTGGGISVKAGDGNIVMAPSGKHGNPVAPSPCCMAPTRLLCASSAA